MIAYYSRAMVPRSTACYRLPLSSSATWPRQGTARAPLGLSGATTCDPRYLLPGERIPIFRLAPQLKFSATPLRDALKLLVVPIGPSCRRGPQVGDSSVESRAGRPDCGSCILLEGINTGEAARANFRAGIARNPDFLRGCVNKAVNRRPDSKP